VLLKKIRILLYVYIIVVIENDKYGLLSLIHLKVTNIINFLYEISFVI